MSGGTCEACGAALLADARFCSRCGTAVEQEQHSERRLATVLFADVVGSTDMAVSTDPEDLRVRLTAFFETCRSVITDCGGRVEKFIGDAVMAVFGVPRAYGDDVDRAVTAALRLVEAVDVPIRVGINTGEVLAVDTGPEGPVAVTGEAVNAAARLQSAAAPGQVLLGERTARAVRSHGTRPLGAISAKGFPEPVPVWEAVAESASVAAQSPLVGRDDEIRLLALAQSRCMRRRTAHLAVVSGEPGAGKSRLSEELLAAAARDHEVMRRVYLTSSPVEAATAVPALGVLARALCDVPDLPRGDLRAAVTGYLRQNGDLGEPDDVARWVAISTGDEAAAEADGVVDERVAAAWARFVRVALAVRPAMVVVDDVQWADNVLLGVLARALATSGDAPLFVVLLTRPDSDRDLTPVVAAAQHVLRFELLPLDAADALDLVRHLLPGTAAVVRERAAERAAGNPFFLHELARVVAESTVAPIWSTCPTRSRRTSPRASTHCPPTRGTSCRWPPSSGRHSTAVYSPRSTSRRTTQPLTCWSDGTSSRTTTVPAPTPSACTDPRDRLLPAAASDAGAAARAARRARRCGGDGRRAGRRAHVACRDVGGDAGAAGAGVRVAV